MKKIILTSLFLYVCIFAFANTSAENIQISGKAYFLNEGDSVGLRIYKYGIYSSEKQFSDLQYVRVKNGQFNFSWAAKPYPQFTNIYFKHHQGTTLTYYIVEPGEKLHLQITKDSLIVSGEKSAGFQLQYQLRKIQAKFFSRNRMSDISATRLINRSLMDDSIAAEQNVLIAKYSHLLDERMKNFLLLNTHSMQIGGIYELLSMRIYGNVDSSKYEGLPQLRKYLEARKKLLSCHFELEPYNLFYLQFVLNKYKVDSCLLTKNAFHLKNYLTYVIDHYSGVTREQLLVAAIDEQKDFTSDAVEAIKNALSYVSNLDHQKYIKSILASRVEGATAYNFALTNTAGKPVRLSDFKGHVVVLDFWFTYCGNCVRLKPYLEKIEAKFKGQPVDFVTICLDEKMSMFLNSVKGGQYTSASTINLFTNGRGWDDIVVQKYQLNGCPTLVLIDKDNKIRNVTTDPRLDNGEHLTKLITTYLQ
ncbi:TlpA family protein disulfide reductase [Mucilaginibacter lacusdianchii]|uniref:TlpA family protein disulfide reductase n=1 Tax=Mucilaginibacter lacusdianchii TaxID=2684211 RepID=UPI00131CBE3D|nr:TlpA disulfide reductase family protein [Mucilaginibacter sp. JXJ CY 39]